jgi:16S rRNA G1207 methylase RsmC
MNTDFLSLDERSFDKIIANPPFSKSQDVKHILHMYELLADW